MKLTLKPFASYMHIDQRSGVCQHRGLRQWRLGSWRHLYAVVRPSTLLGLRPGGVVSSERWECRHWIFYLHFRLMIDHAQNKSD